MTACSTRNQREQVARDETDLHRRCPRQGRDRLGTFDPPEGRALCTELISERNVQDRHVQPDEQQDEGERSERNLRLVEALEAITEHGLSVPQSRRDDISAPP